MNEREWSSSSIEALTTQILPYISDMLNEEGLLRSSSVALP